MDTVAFALPDRLVNAVRALRGSMRSNGPDDVGILLSMGRTQLPSTIEEFQARVDAATGGHATPDDQSVTSDGRVLDTKEKVLAFLTELDAARREGRSVGSP
jgi:hypothetical protein